MVIYMNVERMVHQLRMFVCGKISPAACVRLCADVGQQRNWGARCESSSFAGRILFVRGRGRRHCDRCVSSGSG